MSEIDQEARSAEALKAGLEDYALSDEDRALLAAEYDPEPVPPEKTLPVLAVVGRPNVGKSTLVNRVLGQRQAVVQDMPGVTRDRVRYPAEWAGRDFILLDTGGWEIGVDGLDEAVSRQAEASVDDADAIVFVVDAVVGATDTDMQVARMLQRCGKPVIVAANKVDSASQLPDVASLWSLGLGEPFPVSALHGRGSGDLLDRCLKILPERGSVSVPTGPQPGRVALVGRPNVGKSSLLNALLGEERVVVDAVAGTTRDPVDETVMIGQTPWRFVDTAGIRRKMHKSRGADFYASLRTSRAIEEADIAMVLLDASQPLSEQDQRIVSQAVEAGRGIVIVNNKWDLVDEDRQDELAREYERELAHVGWARRINISAKTTWHTNRIERALNETLDGWRTRIPTGRLNAFLGQLMAANPHPVRGGKQPRILFGTQVHACPPRFVLFTTGFLDPGYRRFIERRLREEYGFVGTPIQIGVRVREKRRRR
ncbi:ribosome biogenesis GTPase Der [Nanchangia anserum]|uniref:GTPase Der n=1 Tax=Nanchangia anserum TaxID=2692125 RepID=A0A8I0KMZ6_9ACTO|nr:ribosome biogenesis GTPase Der [Nanchangia anserum]QOX82474.1 ribosome biogenesis GTPase Der [Nanchangia anserum]